jgi:hypothetical protein
MSLKRALARTMASAFDDELRLRQNHRTIIGKTKKSTFCVPYSVMGWWVVVSLISKYGGLPGVE